MNHKETLQKKIYVVLGIARSGTSVIAKALNVLGIDLGANLNPANKWNPKGFWEDINIVYDVNQKVLDKLNCPIDTFHSLAAHEFKTDSVAEIELSATELLTSRLQHVTSWGFKDPNTVKLLPFWQTIFAKLNLQENYIIALRNPLESANSYQSKTFLHNQEKTLIMWLLHLLPAIDKTHGKKRVVINYEFILQDPLKQLERMREHLAITECTDATHIDNYVNGFLDKNLRHSEYTMEDLTTHPASKVVPLCLKAYKLLLQLATDEIADDENFRLVWDAVMAEFSEMYPLYAYIDIILQENSKLKKIIHKVHRSLIWRLALPLRIIKQFYRGWGKRLKKSTLSTLEKKKLPMFKNMGN